MASVNVNMEMANREVCNIVFVDYATKKPFLNMDYANVTTTEMTGESVYAYGGWGHPKRITFFGERGGTMTFETQITPFKLYSIITGGAVESTANWLVREVVTCSSDGSITISDTEATSASVFAYEDDCGTEIEGTLASGSFTESEASKLKSGQRYVAYYFKDLEDAQRISVKSTTFPGYFTAFMETKMKTSDGVDHLYRLIGYKCAPQTDFSLEFSNTGDPATLSVTCDLMVDDDNNILDMILVD